MFNELLLYPYLKAVCVASDAGLPQFKADETKLRAMLKKTSNGSDTESDESVLYKADGIISLYDFNKVEVLLLETSDHFGNSDNSKSSFDHGKGLFGALSMLKAIADIWFFKTSLFSFKVILTLSDEKIQSKAMKKPSFLDKEKLSADILKLGVFDFASKNKLSGTMSILGERLAYFKSLYTVRLKDSKRMGELCKNTFLFRKVS
ncbi:unnamed protein product [Mucor fragilis]